MKRIVTATALCLFAPSAMAAGASFFDDFDRLDTSRWYISDGWANGAHQNCAWAQDQITVADGILSVGFTKAPGADNRTYRCGEIQTKMAFSFGIYEARMKTPSANSGLNAAFFTYIGPQQSKPHDEMDFEVLLKNPSRVHTTTFVDAKSGNGEEIDLPHSIGDDFIDLALVWTPQEVSWYVDGQLARRIKTESQIPLRDQRIFFSLWGSDTLYEWMGPFTNPAQPIAMEVDWVAYTALGEACQFPESVACNIQ